MEAGEGLPGVRQEVQPHVALRRGAEFRILCHARDQTLHLFLLGTGGVCLEVDVDTFENTTIMVLHSLELASFLSRSG